MTINQQLINRKANYIERDLHVLEKFKGTSLAKYEDDYHIQLQVERLLERIIGRILDINFHLLKDRKLIPNDYHESFRLLQKHQILSREVLEPLSSCVGLRNILAHEYDAIDPEQVWQAIPMALSQVPPYLKEVLTLADPVSK